jgi:hypothetical protein
MSPKTESSGIISLRNITIYTLLDMQATLRHLSSYCTTIGGPRCPDTLESMPTPATFAIGLSYNVIDLMESFTPWKSRRLMGHYQC